MMAALLEPQAPASCPKGRRVSTPHTVLTCFWLKHETLWPKASPLCFDISRQNELAFSSARIMTEITGTWTQAELYVWF